MSSILLAVQATVPNTVTTWNWSKTAVIVGSCLLVLVLAGWSIRYPRVGLKMPLPFPALFNHPSVGTFLAAMSFGHIIGVAAVLGLTNLGIL
ncbi:photosystem I reaction center subunit PsaK [Sphaerospermopsis aphanizomenoides BCCUSP55]|uniref:photosystem I reaction center subunit PsaK n=1 Tax=Sphaerospermopsis aphanizomenoides TaxID=459663 RepID=UPI000AED6C72|nr:photosystem I reaction center subunit PsaK [Sphaerospermopsis aphanizomenoides]MBK1987326.1 photosystem I reaction center subunit PsaK [Sphaerospermopsis aphanizomenoides BCCUSP55]